MNSYKVSVHPYCCCFSRIISSKRPPPFPFPLPHTLLLTLPSSTQAVVLVVLGYLLYTIRRCVFSCAATLLLCHRPPSLGSESETEAWLASQLSQPTKSPRFLWTLTFTEYMVRENLFFSFSEAMNHMARQTESEMVKAAPSLVKVIASMATA